MPTELLQTLVPPALADEVKRRAKLADRSISGEIRSILRRELEADNSEAAVGSGGSAKTRTAVRDAVRV